MSDRCYVQVECLRKDAHLFEELGFCLQDRNLITITRRVGEPHQDEPLNLTPHDPLELVELIDEESGLTIPDDFPQNIVYLGYHGAGRSYDSAVFCSDGRRLAYAITAQDGGFSIGFGFDKRNTPSSRDIRNVQIYRRLSHKVRHLLTHAKDLPPQSTLKPKGKSHA